MPTALRMLLSDYCLDYHGTPDCALGRRTKSPSHRPLCSVRVHKRTECFPPTPSRSRWRRWMLQATSRLPPQFRTLDHCFGLGLFCATTKVQWGNCNGFYRLQAADVICGRRAVLHARRRRHGGRYRGGLFDSTRGGTVNFRLATTRSRPCYRVHGLDHDLRFAERFRSDRSDGASPPPRLDCCRVDGADGGSRLLGDGGNGAARAGAILFQAAPLSRFRSHVAVRLRGSDDLGDPEA